MNLILAAIPTLLVGAGLLFFLRSNHVAGRVAVASQTFASALVLSGTYRTLMGGPALEQTWAWPQPVGRTVFRVDALSAFFLSWSLPMILGGTIYALGYLQPYFSTRRHGGPHYALLNILSASIILLLVADSVLVFLLSWEFIAVASWLLIIWDYRSQRIRFAGFNYLVSTHLGLFVLVAGLMLLHAKTGSHALSDIGHHLSQHTATRGPAFLLLSVAFALKSGFFPFHTWLPRAHGAAPAHVSAILSAVSSTSLGLYAFLRFTLLMGRPDPWMGWTVLAFGAISAFFGVLFTSTQRDLKRLLGYSSTENVGIVAMGLGVGYLGWSWDRPTLALCGFAGAILHIVNHAVFKCLLFYGAGSVYRATHTIDLERLGGLARRMPWTTGLFFVGTAAVSALPPLNGFVGEFVIYAGLLSGRAPSSSDNVALVLAAAVLAFVGAVSALSMTRAVGVAFLGTPRDPSVHDPHDPPASMLSPMLLHALGALALGIVPELGVGLVRATVALFPLGGDLGVALRPLSSVAWASRILAALLLGLGGMRWFVTRKAPRSATWGCGYTAANSRMQYSASSFSDHFARIFASFMPALRREQLPSGLFPQRTSHVSSHHADPVERRLYEVLGQSEEFLAQVAGKVPEQPRFAFAAGLVALLVLATLLLSGTAS